MEISVIQEVIDAWCRSRAHATFHIDSLNNYTQNIYAFVVARIKSYNSFFVRIRTKARMTIRLNNRYQYFISLVTLGCAWPSSTCISASQRKFRAQSANFMCDRVHEKIENYVQYEKYPTITRHVSRNQRRKLYHQRRQRDIPTEKTVINIFPGYETMQKSIMTRCDSWETPIRITLLRNFYP